MLQCINDTEHWLRQDQQGVNGDAYRFTNHMQVDMIVTLHTTLDDMEQPRMHENAWKYDIHSTLYTADDHNIHTTYVASA